LTESLFLSRTNQDDDRTADRKEGPDPVERSAVRRLGRG
jgi:hypothetical protein